MSTWDRKLDLGFRGWKWVASALGVSAVAWVVLLGTRARNEPTRCTLGFQPMDARCCAKGQGSSAGQCVGLPESCPTPFLLVKDPTPGCVYPDERSLIEGGSVTLGPTDWDSVQVVEKRTVVVRSFLMDQVEVTAHRYLQCVADGRCEALATEMEPGRPVTGLSAESAQKFCADSGGRLPTPAEWVYAASGAEGRRFPWGAHGLVCRRASFGLLSGPCAEGGILPDLAGQHPDGNTPDGVFDLSGNVSEWAMTDTGQVSVHGGSFRSKNASDLKTWSTQLPEASDEVGFRCVYPVDVN